MNRSRQKFENTSGEAIFITLEPWCWRYRLEPRDSLEILFGLACREPDWPPLEIHVALEGEKTGLYIFVNGDADPEILINGSAAEMDFESD